ncbi:TlpA family protein disulfide reductase [Hymenobacter taeanensis]|uniref:TlpA family protein disulfide reductase n=1 Tax=Hymenobacter taeanensis TaxID=2735321 RepID=A0A6M6BLA0_9BACT|nr:MULTISPECIES: TlpA disulfide reductase family protein [Hymenobacter]QJX48757.1 TlpA family protein disulfide reductase [Hymenobacter taeanensis]UOQ81737.1 TlpA family protein disulfide reductase [Hymenobacter sp. 5414T-23]
MKQLKFLALAAVLLFAVPGLAQQVTVIKLPELQKRLSRQNDTTYVVNFWATWCAPCVKELPHFDQLTTTYANQKVKVLLVSMDYASQLDKKVKPFVAKRGLKSEVVLLNEPDPNSWMDKVDSRWTGAIPFTILVNSAKKKRATFEQELTAAELNKQVQAFMK